MAASRLDGAVLVELHEEWAKGLRYLTFTDDVDTETLPAHNLLEPQV